MAIRFLSLIFILSLPAVSAEKVCGKIIQTTGKVDILKAINNKDLVRQAVLIKAPYELLCSDIIVTQSGSRAKIILPQGMITLGPNTRIAISKISKNSSTPALLSLPYGRIRTFFNSEEAQKSKDNKQLHIKTSTAVIGVRGTDFYVGFDPNKNITSQATLKGQVEVEDIATQQKVLVSSGQQVQVVSHTDEKVSEKVKEKTSEDLKNTTPALNVNPIAVETILNIRQISVLVNKEEDFTSKEAVTILGSPEKWTPPADEIPGDLKEIKNVF